MNAAASEWRRLDTQAAIDHLLEYYSDFHDSTLRECKFQSGYGLASGRASHLRCFFQDGRPGPIEMVFVDVKSFQLEPLEFDPIDRAGLEWKDGLLCWTSDMGHILSRTALWRPRPGWQGIRERYTAVEPNDLEYYAFEELG